MYVGKDFDPIDPGENEAFALDFVNDLPPTLTISSSVWACVSVPSGADPNAGSRLSGFAAVSGSKSIQRIVGLLAGVRYRLTATATLSDTSVISLYSHVTCIAPK